MRHLIILLFPVFLFSACRTDIRDESLSSLSALADTNPAKALREIDSLLAIASKSERSAKSMLPLRQSRQQAFSQLGQTDSVVEEAQRIQLLARRLDDSLAYARALLPIQSGLDESKIKHLLEAYRLSAGIFARRKMHREQAILQSVQASMLSSFGDFAGSQTLAMESISLPGVYERDTIRAALYQTMSSNFLGMNSYDQAFDYLRQALAIAQALNDSMLQSNILLDLGILHYEFGNDSARTFYQQALALVPTAQGKLHRIRILYNISVTDFEEDRDAEALAGFRYLLDASRNENIPTGEVVAYKALGFFHERKGNPDSAVLYLKRSVALADSIKQPMMKIQALVELEKAYRTAGQAANAAALHVKTDAIRDSMFTVEKTNVIHGLEMRFDTERKALENDNLRQRLLIRQGWVVFLLLLFASSLALIWLLRQRNRLWKERYHSYAVLIDKYRAEMEAERSTDVSATSEISPEPGPRPVVRKTTRAAVSPSPIYTDLQHLFNTKAPYRDPGLSIEEVAQWLNITPRQITSVLREREDVTFCQYVNNFRIREARKIMEDPASESLKLEVIGQRVGIPNRTYFQRVFESIVGVPPGHYRRHIRRDESANDPEDLS